MVLDHQKKKEIARKSRKTGKSPLKRFKREFPIFFNDSANRDFGIPESRTAIWIY